MDKRYSTFFILVVMIGIVVCTENYVDYEDETANIDLEKLREFYLDLLRRKSPEAPLLSQLSEHLMTRKSQRSPSLRLRFGRSGRAMQGRILRPVDSSSNFEDN